MPAGQGQQTLQHAHPFDAALFQHRLRPACAVRSQTTHLAQQPGTAPFDAADLAVGQVPRLRAEAARFMANVRGDLLHLLGEDAHQPAVPTHPHRSGQVLRRHRVVGPFHLDVAIAMDDAPAFAEARETFHRQRLQGRALDLGEQSADLPPRGAVKARVGHGLLPAEQEVVLLGQAGERATLEAVFLNVVDAVLDLALVARACTVWWATVRCRSAAQRSGPWG